jgi:SAM-dependent methyltransferase
MPPRTADRRGRWRGCGLATGYARGVDRLTGVPELLDGPLDDERALVGNLRDLARLNRFTGGTRLSQRAIAALDIDRDDAATTIVDVGTGAADIPMTLLAAARREGRRLTVTATDSRVEILAAARLARPKLGSTPGLELAVADGRGLPFADGAFDVAHASMVVHHLDPEDAVAFLRELRRVARRGLVVNDLVRGRLNWLGAWLLIHATATSRFTRHDGPLSVRRSYTRLELLDLVAAAGLEPVVTVSGFAGHRLAIAAR